MIMHVEDSLQCCVKTAKKQKTTTNPTQTEPVAVIVLIIIHEDGMWLPEWLE